MVITRFAPSPTGHLHLGSARTALFNWLFSRANNGQFLLRIEDTDQERSKPEYTKSILDSMSWLGLQHDGEIIYQSQRSKRHVEIAEQLLANGFAYCCYMQPHEIDEERRKAEEKGTVWRYDGRWRDNKTPPDGVKPVIRLKADNTGFSEFNDLVQGHMQQENKQLDDMVLLRSDGSPTYMLSVVVDDHDMNITHVIRGVDHISNTFRQLQIYKACGWNTPQFAHIPLIHGPDGAKLSKRHGATSVVEYKNFLPEALLNHLLRLGWGHQDQEIFSMAEAIKLFSLNNVGKSPGRFDPDKLLNLNAHYLREKDNSELLEKIKPIISQYVGDESHYQRILSGMDELKKRASTVEQLAENSLFYVKRPIYYDDISDEEKHILQSFVQYLSNDFTDAETCLRDFSKINNIKMRDLAHILRYAITGNKISPSLFEVIDILGIEEVSARCLELFKK